MKNFLINIYRYLFSRKIFYQLNIHIYKLALRGIGVLNSENSAVAGEDFFYEFLKDNFKVKIIFDVGANNGNYAKFIQKSFPKANIYCFEPNERIYKDLKSKTSKYIRTFNIGLSDKQTKDAVLWDFADSNSQPTSTLASTYKQVVTQLHDKKAKSIKIKLDTLDNICKAAKIDTIDFLKIDTEGNEYKVLKGAKKLLNKHKIKVIMFEFNEMNVYSRVFMKDFFEVLRDYNLYRILPDGLAPLGKYRPKEHEIFAFQNIVALDKDYELN